MMFVSISLATVTIFLATSQITFARPESETVISESNFLSPEIFGRSISYTLSPDILSHPDPFGFLLSKTVKSSTINTRAMSHNVMLYFHKKLFPDRYIPFASLLSLLLDCEIRLEKIEENILRIQQAGLAQLPDVPANVDQRLAALFSHDIFADTKPPSQLIRKLLEIPDDKISDFTRTLKDLSNDGNSPWKNISYTRELRDFLTRNVYNIIRLKSTILKVQEISTLNAALSRDQVSDNL